jgi:hypothetical protein
MTLNGKTADRVHRVAGLAWRRADRAGPVTAAWTGIRNAGTQGGNRRRAAEDGRKRRLTLHRCGGPPAEHSGVTFAASCGDAYSQPDPPAPWQSKGGPFVTGELPNEASMLAVIRGSGGYRRDMHGASHGHTLLTEVGTRIEPTMAATRWTRQTALRRPPRTRPGGMGDLFR